jgi:hypothetical protein
LLLMVLAVLVIIALVVVIVLLVPELRVRSADVRPAETRVEVTRVVIETVEVPVIQTVEVEKKVTIVETVEVEKVVEVPVSATPEPETQQELVGSGGTGDPVLDAILALGFDGVSTRQELSDFFGSNIPARDWATCPDEDNCVRALGEKNEVGVVVTIYQVKSPLDYWLDGYRHQPGELRPGFTNAKIGIPPLFQGEIEGITVRNQPVGSVSDTTVPVVVTPTVQEQSVVTPPASNIVEQPIVWTNTSEWIVKFFKIRDGVLTHQTGNQWGVLPAKGQTKFYIVNPYGVWLDGYRYEKGICRPGYTDCKTGIPPKWSGYVEAATLWPHDD